MKILVIGANEPELAAVAATQDNVVLKGVLPDKELVKLVRMASSLLFLSPYEGFGIPMVEAMAAGTPAVVANRSALRDIGADAALLVEPEDAREIASILTNLENDSQLRSLHIDRGHELAQEFTWNRCVDRLINVLKTYS